MRVEGGSIVEVVPSRGRAEVDLLSPGFVDLQVNGHDDVDVATATDAQWPRLLGLLVGQGVTSWCPTLVSAPVEVLDARIAALSTRLGGAGPDVVGLHLEGPFLGDAPGAHTRTATGPVDVEWLTRLPASVRIVTLGPEREGALDAVAALRRSGVIAALGHTTASADRTAAAVDAGATLFTHAFNASGSMHQRAPGALGVALTDDRITISVIADGVHVDARMLRLAWRAKPSGGVVLVTDATAWKSGRLGDIGVRMVDGAPRLEDGTLAGSALRMHDAVRFCVEEVGVELHDAIRAASTVPAALLGLDDRGSITPGRRADLVALDTAFQVEATWIRGEAV